MEKEIKNQKGMLADSELIEIRIQLGSGIVCELIRELTGTNDLELFITEQKSTLRLLVITHLKLNEIEVNDTIVSGLHEWCVGYLDYLVSK